MLRTIRSSNVGVSVATALALSMAVYGCDATGWSEDKSERDQEVSATYYTFQSQLSDGSSILYHVQPDPMGLSGWSTLTYPDGTQEVEWVTLAEMDYGIDLQMVQDPDGTRWMEDVDTGDRLQVLNYQESPGEVSYSVVMPGGAPVDVTVSGDSSPHIVCLGACIAGLVAAGALLICGLGIVLSFRNCQARGGCWVFTFAGGSLSQKVAAACSGSCETWE